MTSLKKTNAEIEKLEIKRAALNSRYSEIKADIFEAMTNEYQEIELGAMGSITPAQAAQQLRRDEKGYAWLPGPIEHRPDFPLSVEDMQSLYEINARLSAEDIEMLESTLPHFGHPLGHACAEQGQRAAMPLRDAGRRTRSLALERG